MHGSILIVDDDGAFRTMAAAALEAEGYEVRSAGTIAAGRRQNAESTPDVIILDRRLPDGDGLDLLTDLRAEGAAAPLIVVVTAYGDVENAVAALQAGAWDYLVKPVQLTDLVVKIGKTIEARGLRDRLSIARSSAAGVPPVEPKSPVMRKVVEALSRVAASAQTPVLLTGPSGAGKQYAAELLHRLTYAAIDEDAPFVEVNCAALPDELVESELFGHERGAFTDARSTRRGLIEMAHGGTLFLDEVTELPVRSQAKLLKFLDSMRFRRLGGQREIEVSLRVVAASNRSLPKAVAGGNLREDLYHRLNVFSVDLPSLAARREDISILAAAFARYFARRIRKPFEQFDARAIKALETYGYPGNVRELRNIIERAVILAAGPVILERDLLLAERAPEAAAGGAFFTIEAGADGTVPPIAAVERAYVARVLAYFEGQRVTAAEALGLSYPTFLKRLREFGLDAGE